MTLQLPDFPWDTLSEIRALASAHPDGLIDLSVGSPVDPTAQVVQTALAESADSHGYPTTLGTAELREAIVSWFSRRRGVSLEVSNVLPTIGSKEFITTLPLVLGLGPSDTVVHPSVAYPSYAIGAAVVGAKVLAEDDPELWPEDTKLIWLNSPGNPTGKVLSKSQLRAAVARARELDAVIVNDECYAELNWEGTGATACILDPEVIEGSRHNILSVYSLSKQSNLAGYRAGIVAGCSKLLSSILQVRKHLGFMVPGPIQAAMISALEDESTVARQREIYRVRREILVQALSASGHQIDYSNAGLYLWVRADSNAKELTRRFAELGILVAPGTFYGDSDHVRVALTANDAQIVQAAKRLEGSDK